MNDSFGSVAVSGIRVFFLLTLLPYRQTVSFRLLAFRSKRDTGELFAGAQQTVLDIDIRSGRMGVSEPLVMEVAAADHGPRVVADGQPHLCLMRFGHIVGSAGP